MSNRLPRKTTWFIDYHTAFFLLSWDFYQYVNLVFVNIKTTDYISLLQVYTDRYHDLSQNRIFVDMADLYIGKSQRNTSHIGFGRPKVKKSKNVLLEKLLALLTTDVQELANSLWEALDNEKDDNQIRANEVVKLKRENKNLRRELDTSRKSTGNYNEMKKRYDDLEEKFNESEEKNKKLKDIEEKYLEYKDELQKSFDIEKQKLQLIIKEQRDKIQALEHAESKTSTYHRERYDHRITETQESETYSQLEKQLKDTREKLSKTEEELDYTKTRLSYSLGKKLLDNNPNIPDLSDRHRPTKLAEVYQEIYDNEWTEAFERLANKTCDNEEETMSTLLSMLVETKSVCEKEAHNQMTKIQLAITQEDRQVNATVISSVDKPLKECRKDVAIYSGTQLYKKHLEELKPFRTSTAQKARLVPKYFEACFNLCWLMAVQDPPLCFGPDVKRGDVFDTNLYKAYTQRGNIVAYVVWPALLLHKGGAVLCKGVAQGKVDHSQRPKSSPNLYQEQRYSKDETEDFFSSPDRYHKGNKDDKTAFDTDRLYSTQATHYHKTYKTENDYEWRTHKSLPHRYDTSDYSLGDLSDASQRKTYTRGHNYYYTEYKRPYNDNKSSISHHKTRESPGTSSHYRCTTDYTQKTLTPRDA